MSIKTPTWFIRAFEPWSVDKSLLINSSRGWIARQVDGELSIIGMLDNNIIIPLDKGQTILAMNLGVRIEN